MKLFLTGFPGSGKSFLAQEISESLGLPLIDTDSEIAKEAGESISEIFEKRGEEYFREQEADFIRSLKSRRKAVISTGGGLPCFHDNMKWMNNNGLTIYIECSAAFLFHRLLRDKLNRPLISKLNDIDLMIYITETLAQRKMWYEQAQLKINGETVTTARLLTAIQKKMK